MKSITLIESLTKSILFGETCLFKVKFEFKNLIKTSVCELNESFLSSYSESDGNFKCKPGITYGFDIEEGLVFISFDFIKKSYVPWRSKAFVDDDRYSHVGMRFNAKRKD